MRSMSTLPYHVSDRAGDDLRRVILQIIDLACDGVEFPIEVIKPRMHVESDVPQLAGDEAKRSFELREPRLGALFPNRRPSANNQAFHDRKSTSRAARDGTSSRRQSSMWPAAVALGILEHFSGCARRTLQQAHLLLGCGASANPKSTISPRGECAAATGEPP